MGPRVEVFGQAKRSTVSNMYYVTNSPDSVVCHLFDAGAALPQGISKSWLAADARPGNRTRITWSLNSLPPLKVTLGALGSCFTARIVSEPEYSFLSLQKGAIPHGYQVPRCRFVRGPFHAKSECFQILHPHLSICPSACGLMKVTGVADPRWSTARSMPIALPSRPPRGLWPVDFQSAERLRASRMCIMVSRLSYHQQGGMLIWYGQFLPDPVASV